MESPYAAPTLIGRWLNRCYARRCLRDSLARGEAPIASHLLYTQVLDDRDPAERSLGIAAGLAWRTVAEASVVYVDRGVSGGMQLGIDAAMAAGLPVERRALPAQGSRHDALRAHSYGASMLRPCTSLNFLSCNMIPSIDAVPLIGRLRSRRDNFPAGVAKLCVPLSEASRNLVRIGNMFAAKSERVGSAGLPRFRCSLCDGRSRRGYHGHQSRQ